MVDISNVINTSISQAPGGLEGYNVNSFLYLSAVQPVSKWNTETYRIYKAATDVGKDFGTDSSTYKDAVMIFSQKPNLLAGNGYLVIAPLIVTDESPSEVVESLSEVVESLSDALNRVKAQIYFGGWMTNKKAEAEEVIAAAQLNETLESIYLLGSGNAADFTAETGLFDKVSKLSLSRTKLLYYGDNTENLDNMRGFVSAYAGRGFSVNFAAQNSTITMNLKDLVGVSPDSTVTEAIYQNAEQLGVDMYVAYNGLPKIVSNGNPLYFDDIYNRLWFELTMRVELFNALATTSTKIPQTETGMNNLKSAARAVCQRGVYNGFMAPGTWNGTDTFGDQDDFYRNIEDFGFYVYSAPVSQQSQSEREARVAPVVQVACKQAGAIHKMNLIINFEA